MNIEHPLSRLHLGFVEEERGPRKSGSSCRPTGNSIQGEKNKVVSICFASNILFLNIELFQLHSVPLHHFLLPLYTHPSPSTRLLSTSHLLLHSLVVHHFLTFKNLPFLRIAIKAPPLASLCPGRSLTALLASATTTFSSSLPWLVFQVLSYTHPLSDWYSKQQLDCDSIWNILASSGPSSLAWFASPQSRPHCTSTSSSETHF